MKYSNIILGGLVAFAGTAVAMPTQEETKKVEPLVLDLMKDDQVALKSGKKTRVEVAESAMALADKADSEAAKLLLMKGAFNLYVRAGEFDKAIETLQALQSAIPDMPPANMANIIEASLRVVSRKNGGQLYRLLDETKTRMRYTSAAKKMEKALKESPNDRQLRTKLAEHYAYLGKWDKALENFIAADGKTGAIAKAEQSGEAGEKAADFWWGYPTGKADELVKSFRTHAAKLYEDAIADGKITGLNKVQAERRIEETKEYGEVWEKIDVSTSGKLQFAISSDNAKTEFIRCPKGKMMIGISPCGYMAQAREIQITRDFWIGKCPVTFGEWNKICGENARPLSDRQNALGGDKCAVTAVTVEQIETFCNTLNRKYSSSLPTGYIFRLPTIAEWEYACRAAGKRQSGGYEFVSTRDVKIISSLSVTSDEKGSILLKNGLLKAGDKYRDYGESGMVGIKLPNALGICDMVGGTVPHEWLLDTLPLKTLYDNQANRGDNKHPYAVVNCRCLNWDNQSRDPLFRNEIGESVHIEVDKGNVVNGVGSAGWREKLIMRNWTCNIGFRLVIGPDLVRELNAKQKK